MTAFAFLEDKDIIEAQQANMERFPGATLRNTVHDVALTRIRRMIQKRIKDEPKTPSIDTRSVAAE